LISSFAFAQFEDDFEIPDRTTVVEPTFQAITKTIGLNEFLKEKLDYPTSAFRQGIEGTVVVKFNVLPEGTLSEIQVINSVCPEYDDAVIKAVKASSGMWSPAMENGHPETMEKEVAVLFQSEESDMYETARMYASMAAHKAEKGKYKRAIKLYNKVVEICPHECALYQRGLAKYNYGDLRGAMLDFERIEDLGSDLTDSLLEELRNKGIYAQK
jgi:TonB family protein